MTIPKLADLIAAGTRADIANLIIKEAEEIQELMESRMYVDVATIPITGDLSDWVLLPDATIPRFAYGNIANDADGRFCDGEHIRTSKIVKIEGDIVVTLNSAYRLIPKEPT